MKVKWVCDGCDTPNVLTTVLGETHALNCSNCGTPAAAVTEMEKKVEPVCTTFATNTLGG